MIELPKRSLFLFLVCLIFINNSKAFTPVPLKGEGVKKIVIDAGHGGHDPGCHGASEKEKHVALAIALKVGALLEKNLPDVEVIYTRKTDIYLELHERANIANKNEADLFVCIHANANVKSSAYGSETYVMGLHKSDDNLQVAKRENSVILMEKDHQTTYQGFDPNSVEGYITINLIQNSYLKQSAIVANKIQQNFKKAGRRNRGVKQAGFLVLHQTAMPSVLVETGFLTNGSEEKFLGSEKGQDIMASAIYEALAKYKDEIEKNISNQDPEKTSPSLIKDAIENQVEGTEVNETVKDTIGNKEADEITSEPARDTVIDSIVKVPIFVNKDTLIKKVAPQNELKDSVKVEIIEVEEKPKLIPKRNEIEFSVQFKTSPTQIPLKPENFKGLPGVREYFTSGHYKYIVGSGTTVDELLFLQNSVRQKGYRDAFIVAFQNGERITIKKALDLLKN